MTRILAIGDIHGCNRSLERLLDLVKPNRDDSIVTLGDYVDRGPSSQQVIDRLLELDRSHQSVPLCGNHETMMMAAREGVTDARRWMLSGVSETLDSYSGINDGVAHLADVPKRHWEFLRKRLLLYHETDEFIFVHGSVAPKLPMSNRIIKCFEGQSAVGRITIASSLSREPVQP